MYYAVRLLEIINTTPTQRFNKVILIKDCSLDEPVNVLEVRVMTPHKGAYIFLHDCNDRLVENLSLV